MKDELLYLLCFFMGALCYALSRFLRSRKTTKITAFALDFVVGFVIPTLIYATCMLFSDFFVKTGHFVSTVLGFLFALFIAPGKKTEKPTERQAKTSE